MSKKVKDFRPASCNANKHTARGMGALQKSIQSDGWIGAMTTAADGEMIAGSARIETVAQVFGTDAEPIIVESDGTRPVVVVRKDIPNADDKRAQRLALADNRVHEIDMSWDVEVLAGFDADVLGELWTPDELSDLGQAWADEQRGKQEDAGAQIDKAEELRVKWGVESGQLWQLGDHRLICGDCTDKATVERVMGGERADFVIADPPYGVSIVAANVSVGGGEGPDGMIPFGGVKKNRGFVGGGEGDSLRHGHYAIEERGKVRGSVGAAKPFGSKKVRGTIGASHVVDVGKYMPIVGDDTTDTAVRAVTFYLDTFPKAAQFWFGANYYTEVLKPSPCWVVWDKETTGNFADCELAWSNIDRSAKLFRHRWNGMLRDSERERRLHPSQKPAALAVYLLTEFGKAGDVVIDPFAGAGWVVMAAENTRCKARAIEIVPDYIAVILERWAQTTGKTPVLVTDLTNGQTES